MDLHLTIQNICHAKNIPSTAELLSFAKAAVGIKKENYELCIRIVDVAEIQALNSQYRSKDKPTNVLSFSFDMENIERDSIILGDLVICAEIIQQEATQQHKNLTAHWAHMVIHGTLHLLGYDHENEEDAQVMEQLEIDILKKFGYDNPYKESYL